MPRSDWVEDECRKRGLNWNQMADVKAILQAVKRKPVDDDQAEAQLRASGNRWAWDIERQRCEEQRLTYDDLPRLAQLILARPEVAALYRSHFALVLVDEFQDLTLQQLAIVNAIGYQRTTYAGDLAQGIYGFTGAQPQLVLDHIRAEVSDSIEFSESHRSSPAVLAVVNSLIPRTGGTPLTCANPPAWPHGGLAAAGSYPNTQAEASAVAGFCSFVLASAPTHRIGVIARTVSRRRFVTDALAATDLPCFQWDDPMLDSETARLMRVGLCRLTDEQCAAAGNLMELIAEATEIGSVQDQDTRKSLTEAAGWAHDLIGEGILLTEICGRIRTGTQDTLLTIPGVHLLTGHVGKGQQFDWVIVIGLEEGCLPDHRNTSPDDIREESRVLSVMVSRARHGVVLLRAQEIPTRNGPWA